MDYSTFREIAVLRLLSQANHPNIIPCLDVAAVEDLILAPADYDAIDAIKAPQGRR